MSILTKFKGEIDIYYYRYYAIITRILSIKLLSLHQKADKMIFDTGFFINHNRHIYNCLE